MLFSCVGLVGPKMNPWLFNSWLRRGCFPVARATSRIILFVWKRSLERAEYHAFTTPNTVCRDRFAAPRHLSQDMLLSPKLFAAPLRLRIQKPCELRLGYYKSNSQLNILSMELELRNPVTFVPGFGFYMSVTGCWGVNMLSDGATARQKNE